MSTVFPTALCERLGLEVPLIQAPMAGVSTPQMAASVSNAGALGSVALGAFDADQARQALRATRALTGRPIAANVFTHPTPRRDPAAEAQFLERLAPLFTAAGAKPPRALDEIYRSFNDDDAMLEVIAKERPEVVSLHFGPAAPERMEVLKSVGCFVIATATSAREAVALEQTGVDAIVVQSYDAGGHSGAFLGPPQPETAGRQGLLTLVRNVRTTVDVPVIAAGGLMTGADIREVLDTGAAAAQLGTAFVACDESLASPTYRQSLMAGSGTRMTSRISGRPARGLVTQLHDALEALNLTEPAPDYPITYDAVKRLVAAVGDPAFAVMWTGTGAASVQAMPAGRLVAMLGETLPPRP